MTIYKYSPLDILPRELDTFGPRFNSFNVGKYGS